MTTIQQSELKRQRVHREKGRRFTETWECKRLNRLDREERLRNFEVTVRVIGRQK